ncbi:site-specific integrase [Mycolicibacterium smegmatis]|uniref:tyrosine-type recombinase/integrase n=1 Tax=Mycolicibacterium smegmatis TaxID=1772 RepID=UPI001E324C3C|nr:site-specific integrase [Mycolicibacterium smegmatis]UGU31362.1 site-specific integrase [Mycolicibacterium smegmatis]ULN72260.1 site-specific integrase [Mycolicibacterium smegmatis]
MAWVKPRQRKDGSVYFSVFFRELNPETGRMQQTSLSWDDPNDAEHCRQLIDQVGPERARGILRIVQAPRQAQTVAQFLTKHIDHLTGVEAGTVARYRSYVKNDLGALAGIPLTALTRDDIARWVNDMSEVASAKTVKNKRDFLSGALKAAVKSGLLSANPAEGVRNPRWDRREMVFLDKAEFSLLLESVTEHWRPLVQFLVSSGCRWSEATALRPSDIDVVAGTVRISKAWKTGAGGYQLGTPKTRKSVRTVNVPAAVLEQLDLSGEWVFTNSGRGRGRFADGVTRNDGRPVRIHSFNPNVWVPAVARAKEQGLTKSPRVHDLRHTCASWLIQAGRPLPAVQQHLGHESIQTTVDVYGHLDRSSGQGNADAIAAMLT